VTKVRPVGLNAGLQDVLARYPQVFSSSTVIPDRTIRDRLLQIANMDPKKLDSIPAGEYNQLREAVSKVLVDVKLMSNPAIGGTARLDKKAVGLFYDLLNKGVKEDMRRWGNAGSNQKAYKAFENSFDEWQKVVIPWRENPVQHSLREVGPKFGAPKTAKIISQEPDTAVLAQMQDYIRKFGPYGGDEPIEALATQSRAANLIGNKDPSGIVTPTFGVGKIGALTHSTLPMNMYFGNPGKGPLNYLTRQTVAGTGREFGPEISTVGAGLQDVLFGSDSEEGKSIGSQTQDSFRHPGTF